MEARARGRTRLNRRLHGRTCGPAREVSDGHTVGLTGSGRSSHQALQIVQRGQRHSADRGRRALGRRQRHMFVVGPARRAQGLLTSTPAALPSPTGAAIESRSAAHSLFPGCACTSQHAGGPCLLTRGCHQPSSAAIDHHRMPAACFHIFGAACMRKSGPTSVPAHRARLCGSPGGRISDAALPRRPSSCDSPRRESSGFC